MAETQLYPSVVVAGVPTLVNGIEILNQDIALVGVTAGLADDRTLAELLRLVQFDGANVSRGILPTGSNGAASGVVQPTGFADRSISVFPFRAVVGSRIARVTDPLENWRGIRSGVWGGATVSLVPNTSGNPRWDLVYVSITVDDPAGLSTRRTKDPSSGVPSIVTVARYLQQKLTVNVLTGTPGATPALPALPADSGNVYNVALAYVRAVDSFATILAGDIRDEAPVLGLASQSGAASIAPATGNNDGAATYATHAPWSTTAGARPATFVPPSMVGGVTRFVICDWGSSASPSHPDGSVVDNSIDWRNRFFQITAQITITDYPIASNPAAASEGMPLPDVVAASGAKTYSLVGHSFPAAADGVMGTGDMSLFYSTPVLNTFQGSGTVVGIYVDSSGVMRARMTGTNPGVRVFAWITATGPFPNA